MKISSNTLVAIFLLASNIQDVYSHGYVKSPRARNYVAAEDGMWSGGADDLPQKENCPSCLNTKPIEGFCGNNDNRNYDSPLDAIGRPLAWSSQATYVEGQIIEVTAHLPAHHDGHFVMRGCPEGTNPSESCFSQYVLEFMEDTSPDSQYKAPKDLNYPERGYVGAPNGSNEYTHRLKLPQGLVGDKVLLHWHWITGNSCLSEGYDLYPWPPGWKPDNMGQCPPLSADGVGTPEQFWNCIEVTINPSNGDPTPTPPTQPPPPPPSPPTNPTPVAPTPPTPPGNCQSSEHMTHRVGYYQSWAKYRSSGCDPVTTNSLNASGYTHMIYSFAKLCDSLTMDAWNRDDIFDYMEFQKIKQANPGLKTMIAVGGWTHNDPGPLQKRFSDLAADPSARKAFAITAVNFLRNFGFDGLDLDWEYPGAIDRGGTQEDKAHYVLLVEEIRKAFDAAPENFELSMAVPMSSYYLQGFDLPALAQHVHWFNLMAYDFHGHWDNPAVVNPHTSISDIATSHQLFIDAGIPSEKLVLGLAAYGRTYTLSDTSCTTPGCGFNGAKATTCTNSNGFMSYFEIENIISSNSYDILDVDTNSGTMYLVKGDQWIGFDNESTFASKIQYAESSCMRGTFVWASDMTNNMNPTIIDHSPTMPPPPPPSPPVTPAPVSPTPSPPQPTTPVPPPPTPTPGSATFFSTNNIRTSYEALIELDKIRYVVSSDPPIYSIVSEGGAAGSGDIVSEGQGYGVMVAGLTLASMERNDPNRSNAMNRFVGYFNGWKKMCEVSTSNAPCQANFRPCGNGNVCLPGWKINKEITNVIGTGAAPDGDQDAIVGMIFAVKAVENDATKPAWYEEVRQWADASSTSFLYHNTKKSPSGMNRILKLGSCWGGWENDGNNPSYHAPGAMRMMRDYQEHFHGSRSYTMPYFGDGLSLSERWDKTIDTSYKFVKASQCSNIGVVPNWAMAKEESDGSVSIFPGSFSGSGTPQYEFGAEASRTIWRALFDVLVHPVRAYNDASSFLLPLQNRLDNSFANNDWPENTLIPCDGVNAIFSGWKWNGFMFGPVYSSLALGSSNISSSEQQTMVEAAGMKVNNISNSLSYYSLSWQVIAIITLNGDVARAGAVLDYGSTPPPPPPSSPTTPAPVHQVTPVPVATPVTPVPVATPATPAPISPTPPPPPSTPSGCCSYNYKDCDATGWCAESASNCGGCNGRWLEGGAQTGCIALWGACTSNPNGCCGSAKCVGDQWYSQCKP
jgi:chitinase